MLCKIALLQVVGQIVEWCDYRIREKIPPGSLACCVEFGIERYGDKHENESGYNHDE